MKELIFNIFIAYLGVINIIAAIVVLYDKSISKLPRGSIRRVAEKTFVFFSAIGGGVGTLFAMLMCRHKTKSHNGLLFKIGFFAVLWTAAILILL